VREREREREKVGESDRKGVRKNGSEEGKGRQRKRMAER
jgi:hypothetical protein